MNDAHPLWNHVELFVRPHANLYECALFMRPEPLCFRQIVPRDFTGQTKVKRLASAFAASAAC
jgi:hypothetical protein